MATLEIALIKKVIYIYEIGHLDVFLRPYFISLHLINFRGEF